tara:strand:+ start:1794 stop:2219 length:426 start_codon:yes stop_codon:yes gene_type:complete
LNPKKSSDIFPIVAKAADAKEQLVEAIVSFYWKEIRDTLVNCKSHNVFIDGLGTFKAKPWKLPEVILKYERMVKKYQELITGENKLTLQKFSILKDYEEKLEKLYKLRKMIDADKDKKEQVKQKRHAEKNKNNLGQPETDN